MGSLHQWAIQASLYDLQLMGECEGAFLTRSDVIRGCDDEIQELLQSELLDLQSSYNYSPGDRDDSYSTTK